MKTTSLLASLLATAHGFTVTPLAVRSMSRARVSQPACMGVDYDKTKEGDCELIFAMHLVPAADFSRGSILASRPAPA